MRCRYYIDSNGIDDEFTQVSSQENGPGRGDPANDQSVSLFLQYGHSLSRVDGGCTKSTERNNCKLVQDVRSRKIASFNIITFAFFNGE